MDTVPFDLERFRAGEAAIMMDGKSEAFVDKTRTEPEDILFMQKNWVMRPETTLDKPKPVCAIPKHMGEQYYLDSSAYSRYRTSARGKRAIAAIGIVDAPLPPSGQCKLEEIFAEALNNFDAEIEKKRR